ncbi:MAG TPA: ATP-dependent helicase HrpB [bacterium]|nr:ATP-dependent helicase HrpB [bacterium]
MDPLPIDPLIPGIRDALEKHNAAVVVAEPGAGKTTRVPPALLSSSFVKDKEIWVLQPRRLAAKLAATRVAQELGEEPGNRVGYQFRFEKRVGPATRLRFMTDGMLLPLAQADPTLSKVAAVVLDEFHERSLALELGLGFLHRLQLSSRPDLRILMMSATLDSQALSQYLSNCPVFESKGRVFPVTVDYLPAPEQPDLALKVKGAIRHLAAKGPQETTLVFLPGLAEIRQAESALKGQGLEVHALYGDLPVEEQRRILQPTGGAKVILSTNVAETSLTVPGVTAVVDSGLTRQARVSAWSGIQSLVTVPASQASATQRAGRAGRLREGTCLRLYTKFDFEHRAAFDVPEILRADLSKSLLDLMSLGVKDLEQFPWFLKPSPVALEAAHVLLANLGAVTREGDLTETGRRMARLPLAPRLAKFLLQVEEDRPGDAATLRQACRLAVLINEEKAGSEDLLEELHRYKPGTESQRLVDQLEGFLKIPGERSGKADPETLAKALLTAFPDRVAQVRGQDTSETRNRSGRVRELLLSGGGTALAQDSALTREHGYFVVVEAQETAQTSGAQAKARSLCPIESDWLLELFMDDLVEEKTCEWNAKAKRVEGFKRLKYGQLALEEKPLGLSEFGPEAASLLLKQALAEGPAAYCDPEELSTFLNRVKFVSDRAKGFPEIGEAQVNEALKELCGGNRSLAELREAGLVALLRSRLAPKESSLLEKMAPASLDLPSGRKLVLHYEAGKPPWGESRIQDFFGLAQGPTVAGGEVPVVLHLLSPAKRPVQITADLAGFWKNHYPQTRKELMRRYPKHKWPERPE